MSRYTAGWDVIHACNYRCPYCFFIPSWTTHPEETNGRHLGCTAEDWAAFWERLGSRYGEFEVEVAGGEPFFYPGFVALAARVARPHRLRIVTNLSLGIEEAARRLDPARVAFSASFHPHFTTLPAFSGRVRLLLERGFSVMTSVVAYPEGFDSLPQVLRELERVAGRCFLNPFQGEHGGRRYPEAYTAAQRAFLETECAPEDRTYRLRSESPFGRPCLSGSTHFRAWPDGVLHRCCQATDLKLPPLGHIKDVGFRLAEGPAPCPARACFAPNEIRLLV